MEGAGMAKEKGAMPQHGILLIMVAKAKSDGKRKAERKPAREDKGRESKR